MGKRRCQIFLLLLFLFCLFPGKTYAKVRYAKEYSDLSKQERALVTQVMNGVKSGKNNVRIPVKFKMTQTKHNEILMAVKYSYFQYVGDINDYLSYSRGENNTVSTIVVKSNRIQNLYNRNRELDKKAKKWTKACIKKKMSAAKKRDAISKYIAKKTKYSNYGTEAENILSRKKGCCQAYASLYKEMCRIAGIKCRMCIGTDHIWNAVKIKGKWQYVDVTFYDATKISKYLHFRKLSKDYKFEKHQTLFY